MTPLPEPTMMPHSRIKLPRLLHQRRERHAGGDHGEGDDDRPPQPEPLEDGGREGAGKPVKEDVDGDGEGDRGPWTTRTHPSRAAP